MNNKIGIYFITNIIDNKRYIGQTINFNKRKKIHLYKLTNNKHVNKHLQNSWNKYGKENFVFELFECNKIELDNLEIFLIFLYKTQDRKYGYNILEGGNQNPMKNKDVVEKVSNKLKNVKYSNERKIEMSKIMKEYYKYNKHPWANTGPMLNRKHKKETIEKMSQMRMGHFTSEETKKKISNSNKGKKRTKKQKEKISLSKKGKPWTAARRNAQNAQKESM